jgi:hypothetical protein
MKTIAVRLLALVALMFPVVLHAATAAQVDAWKAGFPPATTSDSASLHRMIAGYQQLVIKVTPAPSKLLSLLKEKLTRDQITTSNILHPPKPNPRITAAMRADAEEASHLLNEKFAPFLARVPQ